MLIAIVDVRASIKQDKEEAEEKEANKDFLAKSAVEAGNKQTGARAGATSLGEAHSSDRIAVSSFFTPADVSRGALAAVVRAGAADRAVSSPAVVRADAVD